MWKKLSHANTRTAPGPDNIPNKILTLFAFEDQHTCLRYFQLLVRRQGSSLSAVEEGSGNSPTKGGTYTSLGRQTTPNLPHIYCL